MKFEKLVSVEINKKDLIKYPFNPRKKVDQDETDKLRFIIREHGFREHLEVWKNESGKFEILCGNHAFVAASLEGLEIFPCTVYTGSREMAAARVISDNKASEWTSFDVGMLKDMLIEIDTGNIDLRSTGFYVDDMEALMDDGAGDGSDNLKGSLVDQFGVPPFSVLDARQGYWQDRKRLWLALGIKSEVGRDAPPGGSKMISRYGKNGRETGLVAETGTSIFDPVVCELSYSWFSPVGGTIVDPFAGGSVRGIVASKLGRFYWGCDLSEEQVTVNREQAKDICDDDLMPAWVVGDSAFKVKDAPQADFIFSCPPYGDLEKYSDDPADISSMKYSDFIVSYRKIIALCCDKLKQDRFACFVVGDFRDKKGNYRDFVSDTISAFTDNGLNLYNEAILVTSLGSLPLRASSQFKAGRKLGKTHQNVLVFVKGSGKAATLACGHIDIYTHNSEEEGVEI